MCTAISVDFGGKYFGRNLDYEHSFGEEIIVTPRNFIFEFTNGKRTENHYAMIGMGIKDKTYPLYFDATNEKGLSMAGLNFPDYAKYSEKTEGRDNVASFELIPWILSQCASAEEAKIFLSKINITNQAVRDDLPPTPLHWLIADGKEALTLEQTKEGVKVYQNEVGVLTNSPEFNVQMINLCNYMNISSREPENNFSQKITLKPYSRGMGGIGIPGDLSSMSRFVRASFTKLNSVCGKSKKDEINQFFHILYSVYQQKGCARVGEGYEITNYSSCCDILDGVYYYTTYSNSTINCVDMHRENLDGEKLVSFDISRVCEINMLN